MKPSSPNHKIVSRATARNAALINQLATPGVGSLIAGKWLAGSGQLLLGVTGCIMVLIFLFQWDMHVYGEVTEKSEPAAQGWLGKVGAVLFAASWLWALMTSLSLIREARKNEDTGLGKPPLLK